jgi:DNA-binding CsgD family transcriptional regulator
MSQLSLSGQDVRAMLALTRPFPEDDGPLLPWALLRELSELIPCDSLEASWQDTPRWDIVDQPLDTDCNRSPDEWERFAAIYRQHYWTSLCSYPDRTGDTAAVFRGSDRLSDRQLRNTAMFTDLSKPMGSQHGIFLCLSGGAPGRTVRLLFDRGPGPDFTERHLAILTLLQPHLQAAYDTARRRRRGGDPLTSRQREIVRLVSEGTTDQQIATRLHISQATVGKHLENVYSRLGISSRSAAVAWFLTDANR